MTKPMGRPTRDLREENINLRCRVEQLEEKNRQERRRATLIEEELAFVRGQHERMLQRRLNGGA
jgi:hypothetical protein